MPTRCTSSATATRCTSPRATSTNRGFSSRLARLTATVTVDADRTRRGIARLFTFEGARTRNVTLETSANNRVRLRIGEGWTYLPTDWLTVEPGDRVEVTVTADTERDRFRISVSGRTR